MDSLEEQLVKLSIINSRPLSPRVNVPESAGKPECGKVASLVNSLQENSLSLERAAKQTREGGACRKYATTGPISPKKVGPIVPPKPHKKKSNFPEVPQSSLVKQACEPLFSQRLQCLDGAAPKLNAASRPPLLQRKQPMYASKSGLYDKTSKVTLDNPAVLEQQLEALAHHKKQLEKKGLLQQHQEQSSQSPIDSISCIPKLSSTSLMNDIRPSDHAGTIYSNMRPIAHSAKSSDGITTANASNCSNVYGNITANAPNNIYSNVFYAKDSLDDLPLPPPAVLSIATMDAGDYMHSANEHGDEIPPPPSPVSSSYSELRRATDVFSKKPAAMQQQQQQENADAVSSSNSYAHYVENGGSGGGGGGGDGGGSGMGGSGDKSKGALNRQTYMNMHYSNEYSSYSPTLQSMSQDSSDYYGYGSFSQGSSTYESIYEPINPRPPSQLSSRSNYLMYSPYVNGPQVTDAGGGMLTNSTSSNLSSLGAINTSGSNTPLYPSGGSADVSHPGNHQKEAEVEVLTDFLVHSMDTNNDADNFGICYKCNERVLGENSGCTAMDQIYHIACFTCCQCQINLQGKPFYALEGKPYCEFDYLQTLEKCSVCMKPILERILRATGKPYHPQCFTCIVCGNSLDGIPFTVDATNQNYCIADFHKKFAPRCCVCKEPIMPEPGEEETVRVVALDRSFHFECYKCEDCGLLLSSEAEGRGCYPLDDHVLCKSCNAKRVQMLTNRMTTEL